MLSLGNLSYNNHNSGLILKSEGNKLLFGSSKIVLLVSYYFGWLSGKNITTSACIFLTAKTISPYSVLSMSEAMEGFVHNKKPWEPYRDSKFQKF